MEGKEVMAIFIVVNSFSLYTAILGRPWIHAMGAIPSTLHMKIKFRTEQGVATIRGNRKSLGNILSQPPTRRTNKLSRRELSRKCRYSNYKNTKKRKGLLVPRDWKR